MDDDREENLQIFRKFLRDWKLFAILAAGFSVGSFFRYLQRGHSETLLLGVWGLAVCGFCLWRLRSDNKRLHIIAALKAKIDELESARR